MRPQDPGEVIDMALRARNDEPHWYHAPADSSFARRDARWASAWDSGEHPTKADCAKALGVSETELRKALERQRKRTSE